MKPSSHSGSQPQSVKSSRAQSLRDHLRDVGPATAVELADMLGLGSASLISDLLAKDLILGRIIRDGALYCFNAQYAAVVRAREEDLAHRLRLGGWTVTPPDASEASAGVADEHRQASE